MSYLIIFVGVAVWLGFGVLSWGFYQGAHRNSSFAWCKPEKYLAALGALFGPVNFVAVGATYGLDHWSWTPITRQERWEIHRRNYSVLGRTYENFDRSRW